MKFAKDDFEVKHSSEKKAESKGNMDKYLGTALISMVAAKKEEILSKGAIKELEAQPKLAQIQDIMRMGINNHVAETNASLSLAMREYNQNKPIKWVVFVFFLVLGGLLGTLIPMLVLHLDSSAFSRVSLDNIMFGYFGARHFPEMLTNELMVISYEYNS